MVDECTELMILGLAIRRLTDRSFVLHLRCDRDASLREDRPGREHFHISE